MTQIYLRSGRNFDFLNPDPASVDIADIASALSKLCRFTGHGRFYSVAEHSVRVSYMVPPEFALWGLLHDAAEAYLGDVAKPLKSLLPDYQAIEDRVEAVVFPALGLIGPIPPEVKLADAQALSIEKRRVLGCAEEWLADRLVTPKSKLGWHIASRGFDGNFCWDHLTSAALFRARFHELQDNGAR